MRELYPGHFYQLDNLKDEGTSYLQFHMDRAIHEVACRGPSTQEVIRACIARVKHLDTERHWWGNRFIIALLRGAIFLFEVRAILRKAEKAKGIENLPTRRDGHL